MTVLKNSRLRRRIPLVSLRSFIWDLFSDNFLDILSFLPHIWI